MQTVSLPRQAQTKFSTWGPLILPSGMTLCKVLERGPANPEHPRIPAGTYQVEHRPLGASHFDEAFAAALLGICEYKGVLWLPHVPNRTYIEIHTANYISQLLGCLALGNSIGRDAHGDFSIVGGTSIPAFKKAYPVLSAMADTGLQIEITDPQEAAYV